MENKAYLTAIGRSKPSLPARWAFDNYKLKGRVLDYGCGRGADANWYGFKKYDPHFFPVRPTLKFDTILCSYVLNVIPKDEASNVLDDIRFLLKKNGTAYITVRRDISEDYVSSKGTLQRLVELPLPIERETAGYCIYRMKKGE